MVALLLGSILAASLHVHLAHTFGPFAARPMEVAFSPDSQTLAAANEIGRAHV